MLDTPLFRYAFSRPLSDLQKLAKDMTDFGVFYNNSFGERTVITKKDDPEMFKKALNIVEKAILALHSDGCRDEERHNPDLDKEIAPTEPNVFFVTTDGEGKNVPPPPDKPESSASGVLTTTRKIRMDSEIYLIAGFFINEYFKSKDDVDDIMIKMAYGKSIEIGRMKQKIENDLSSYEGTSEFSSHMKDAAERYCKLNGLKS
jgi:hypothetical protein|tara:strand:+ start:166 stop:774 length:609 start_codon:yes stop_codon:yes gene_type:complete